jgi:uncharacterized repeat protein (TIGR03806 family)
MMPLRFVFVLSIMALAGCSRSSKPFLGEPWPKKLSEWKLFEREGVKLKPAAGVIPYDLNSPLFSDYAEKERFVWMPAGTSATYHETETFEFPKGAVIAKTFAYGGKRIETRLLVNGDAGWTPLPYVWNDDQTEATLDLAADARAFDYKHASGETLKIDYVIPNQNQCKGCHDQAKRTTPIGPKARNLNREFDYPDGRENQLVRWTKIGYLKGAPADPPKLPNYLDAKTGTLEQRARAYLDINCAHCHNPNGPANTTGLYLTATNTKATELGVCKVPVAAGQAGTHRFGIQPGNPDESIVIHRMMSVEPKVMMPELGRSVVHREGVELIRAWIQSIQGDCSGATLGY